MLENKKIPPYRAIQIERLTGGRIKIDELISINDVETHKQDVA